MDFEDADDNNNPADDKQNPLVFVSVLNTVFKEHALFDAVLAAIVSKDNSIFQKSDKIDHLDNRYSNKASQNQKNPIEINLFPIQVLN